MGAAARVGDPAMTDFRAWGTIMGPAGLTAVFGMGTGGAPPVSSPELGRAGVSPGGRGGDRRDSTVGRTRVGSWPGDHPRSRAPTGRGSLRLGMVASWPGLSRPRVRGGGESGWSSRSAVRTGRLRRSPVVHSRPIDLVVSQEPSHRCWCRKPRLEEGFALRCLQRLSFPDLATRRCPERDSRHTRGRSSPILSY